jgi:ribosomal-protein-alanine N-acetyltransferase
MGEDAFLCAMAVTLRPWREEDAQQLSLLGNDPLVARFMTDGFPHPYRLEDAERFIRFASSHEPRRLFAVISDGELAGGIGVHPQEDIWRKNAELGYWVAQAHWGKGVATEAIRQIIPIGFSLDGITRIFARPFGTNKGSQRALEKNYFTLEATIPHGFFKNGEYYDELIYSIRKNGAH